MTTHEEIIDIFTHYCAGKIERTQKGIFASRNAIYFMEYVTKDNEVIKLLAQEKDIFIIVADVLALITQRLETKHEFHKFIEEKYPDIAYTEYEALFKEYQEDIQRKNDRTLIKIKQIVEYMLEVKNNGKFLDIPKYKKKEFISKLFENSINETIRFYESVTQEDKRDYSLLNFLDDLRILWVQSIRDKDNVDIITKHFHDVVIYTTDRNTDTAIIDGLPTTLHSIMVVYKHNHKDKKTLIIFYLLGVFKDIELVKALCTHGHNQVKPLMDKKTFNKKLQHDLIQETLYVLNEGREFAKK